ncbi:LysR family glycine cleavage system transcriptional activator [Pseudochelatococcus lubricantis]|uniref:LysR family glycine cleavage system transcriptional activator n=1 Tax=Pseudochelatococcus lubricantis TaxID=1538102 RepID=A0ABX0V1L2_9HYPH|nr:LysR family transcriptional regulator [Pseudochelatococcus lubricantis]NIJ59089.1 LysR family glycine cleavage system transcriptional activator [Pseudochelatococcus lubricantis]
MAFSRSLMPSFQEMTAFEAAARHGNFTRAAEELALTQSAVSKQIRQLEDTLGVVLFDRTKGRVTLTRPGERYLRSVRKILRDYEVETHAIVASAGSDTTLTIAVLPTFGSRWLIPRLPDFIARHPSLTVNLTSEPKPFDFSEKSVDIAIHYGAPTWPQGEATYLCDENIIAVASPAYAQARGLRDAANLLDATLLQQASRPGLWRHWFDEAHIDHPHPYRGPIFDQFAMTIQAAAVGMGVALAPGFLVEQELADGRLIKLNEVPFAGPGAYYIVTPLKTQHSALISAFTEWIIGKTTESRAAPA